MLSLADLLARAGEADTVTVPAGLVPGSGPVRIDRSVHLLCTDGAELSEDIVVRSPATLTLSGITGTGVVAVAPGARLLAWDCRFTPPKDRAAITAAGPDCAVQLTACRFTGAEANAVRLRGGAAARVIDCEFASFGSPAVVVAGPGTHVELADCRFAGMTGHAVLAEDGGAARIAGCSFAGFLSDRWTAVIAAASGGTVEVDGCRFAPMTAHGVFVRGGGRALVRDCRFEQSAAPAAVSVLGQGSAVEVTGCRFTASTGRGVEAGDGGRGRVSGCDLAAVGDLAPLYAEGPGSSLSLAGCRIASAHSVGAAAAGGAELDVGDCHFDCPGAAGLADGIIGLGRDGTRLRMSGACTLPGTTTTVTGTLEHRQAAVGTAVTLSAAVRDPCPGCNTSGGRPGVDLTACPRCGGHGRGPQDTSAHRESLPLPGSHHPLPAGCPDCRGSGLISEDPCTDCAGSGAVARDQTLQITIPAGVQTGYTLIAAGHGGAGLGGGPPGDLHIVVTVLDPPFRTVEEYFEKTLGVQVAASSPSGPSGETTRRELDEAVRREAIRLGYLLPDDGDDVR